MEKHHTHEIPEIAKSESWQKELNKNQQTVKLKHEESEQARSMKSIQTDMYQNFVTHQCSIVGVAVKEGQQLHGVELSPGLFRRAGLLRAIQNLGWKVKDLGDITISDLEDKICEVEDCTKKYKYELENCEILGPMNEELCNIVHQAALRKDFVCILGGDHGLATGSITGMLRAYENLKVVWIDAHGDCNIPETSPSGNYHGMPAAHLMGWMSEGELKGFDWFQPLLKPENLVYIGLRDVDDGEKALLQKHNIKCYSPYDIEKLHGISNVMDEVCEYLEIEEGQRNPVHISWDVDACDPEFMSGTGTRARCGLTLRESHFILKRLWLTKNLVSMDMVEVNTLLEEDQDRETLHGDSPILRGKKTILYACELILSGLGSSWL